jgi:uncharacterized protein YndB with AHSA1/START domain
MSSAYGIRHETEVTVSATPGEVWQAITDPAMTRGYYYGTDILSDWTVGAPWTSRSGDELYLEGEILEIDAPRRLVQTFHVASTEEDAINDAPSTVTWEVTPVGDATRVRVIHDGMGEATRNYTEGGWEHILAGLKTLVETGKPLAAAATM